MLGCLSSTWHYHHLSLGVFCIAEGEAGTYSSHRALPHMVSGSNWPRQMLMGDLGSGEDGEGVAGR